MLYSPTTVDCSLTQDSTEELSLVIIWEDLNTGMTRSASLMWPIALHAVSGPRLTGITSFTS